ncbi:MAG: hypothetical protein ACR2QH_11770 [Geminicoccaceae bacterium]
MTRYSLPIKRLDGSVFVEALRPAPSHPKGARRPRRRRAIGFNNIEVHRGKIVRDIAILILLAITIIAGSAALIGLILGDVTMAVSQTGIVVAEQAAQAGLAQAGLAETELVAAPDERFEHEIIPMALAGFGVAVAALALTRSRVALGG